MTTMADYIRDEVHIGARYSRVRLTAGLLGRLWLWFVAACLAITVLPIAIGWTSYVISSGSMEPRISTGDVVLGSPGVVEDDLVGRVVSFTDPDDPDSIITHRVVALDENGDLITKGDANLTPDSTPVPLGNVKGTDRLLVRFVGLPVVWARNGDWTPVIIHVLVLLAAVAATVYDYEPLEGYGPSLRSRIAQRERANPDRLRRRPAPTLTMLPVLLVALAWSLLGSGTTVSAAAFTTSTRNTSDSWGIPNWSYTTTLNGHGPYLYWKLDETGTVTTAADASGNGRTGTYFPNGSTTYFTRLTDGAFITDSPDRAVQLSNGACINTTSSTAIAAPQVFTVIAWFKAPSTYTAGGKLIGFERPQTGVAVPTTGAYDRHLYMDGQGRIWFGVYNNAHVALSSAAGLNNNNWHMALGTQSSSGMRLYIDGALVASNTNTVAEAQNGWWRAGCGNLSGWGANWGGNNNPGTDSTITQDRTFAASIDEVAVLTTALTDSQIAFLYWTR